MKLSLCTVILVLSHLLTLRAVIASEPTADLAGRWVHDQGRSDQHSIGPEYPGRWMEVTIEPTRIEVEQALGGVRDGFPTAGSGDQSAVWSLATDGTVHDVTIGRMTRPMSAIWQEDGALRMSYALPVEDGEVMTGVELWRLIEDGARLEIERSMTFSGREKVRRIVFRREP